MSWSYDAFGNRTAESFGGSTTHSMPTSSTASYNSSNRVSASSLMLGGAPTYDAAGDVTGDNLNQYAYDGEGRVCAVENASGIWGYLYNAEGVRVAKGAIGSLACPTSASSFTSVKAQYLLGPGGEQVTELTGSGAWTHTNIWAGGLDATYDATGLHFHLKDPLGTRRVQLAAGGGSPGCVENSFQSLPFGNHRKVHRD
jgi:YD repeat-containing protein